ncbi:penicillin-binding transpeptidase domain-containing protein [Amycolatopsis sp., V23-08]|uniref:Penicillin-binding transpeptidase domain-containing protein n=1 Tax=Amycolatopsis heterodermiae TaxID=3110235 RepID=A0ABU5RJB2_9PSEU|nr:penicillin-binding transpeptidase domain-containing protein [Amycolatopsis sp., V23-08]MEA5366377.1 penicillin-binding transpeptidase domain-containing protein [Amycolatopsis sp., V23-08]
MSARRSGAVLAVLLLAASTAAGCSGDGPEDALSAFLDAVASGDVAAAAADTDSPDAAKTVLTQVRAALDPESLDVEDEEVKEPADGDTVTAGYQLTWHLPHGRTWTYRADAQLRAAESGWQVHWQPTVVHPQLAVGQTLGVLPQLPETAPVLDRDGVPLMRPQTVIGVVVDPQKTGDASAVAKSLAAALHRYEPSVTGRALLDGMGKTKPGSTFPVITLRAGDYQRVKPVIYDLPGVRFAAQERLLPVTRGSGAQVLPAIRALVEQELAGAAGWRIVTQDVTGGEVSELQAEPPKPGPAITSTLSARVQAAAEKALETAGFPAALVAIQPSSGDILAVAQNEEADAEGSLALAGRFPPGSTFKIITAAAALADGDVEAGSPVDCPGTTTIENRVVPNEGRFDLGRVPLKTAFAKSCNTTFARLASGLSGSALTDTARSFGIGADFVVPGLTTVTGAVPATDSAVQRAENGFGQGTVVTSPFGMALVAATVQAGKVPTPSLVKGRPATAQNVGDAPSQDVLDALRGMMREVVTSGTATGLRDIPDVAGKTGTAQFGDGSHSHGWFVGYRGDLAFAVLLTGAGSSKPAVQAAHRFLAGIG